MYGWNEISLLSAAIYPREHGIATPAPTSLPCSLDGTYRG